MGGPIHVELLHLVRSRDETRGAAKALSAT